MDHIVEQPEGSEDERRLGSRYVCCLRRGEVEALKGLETDKVRHTLFWRKTLGESMQQKNGVTVEGKMDPLSRILLTSWRAADWMWLLGFSNKRSTECRCRSMSLDIKPEQVSSPDFSPLRI